MSTLAGHNPDILTCLANLSADEVFTPPKLAAAMLDLLPQDLFRRHDTTFLDPVCKSGVFLREIAKRLNEGLKDQMPDTQARIDHILTRQVFGMAITELTGHIARRSVYCSKKADGKFSIASGGAFNRPDGNIRLPKAKHRWDADGRCADCGASRGEYDRDETLETYAYPFIHGADPTKEFSVKFDVIVGNPPYQLSDGGFGRSASPIYHQFVRQAKRLEPRSLIMVIPSRWFGGGKGLDDFREEMLADRRLRRIVDFENASDVFPGVSVAGGICYFLWERDYNGDCEMVNVQGGTETTTTRRLNEFDIFIRESRAVPIVRKLMTSNTAKMNEQVSSYKPFGLRTYEKPMSSGDIKLYWQKGVGPYKRSAISSGVEMIDRWKVICSRSGNEHAGNPGTDGSRRVLSRTDVLPPGTICTETYLVVGHYATELEANNLLSYMKTRLFRFLMSLFMYSHGITKDTFAYIPILDMTKRWTDPQLAKKFGLTEDEVAFIESKIRAWEE
ncbi:MAG: Eco57I restriction-modification methylase domain-containing protein [Phycisphaeraceae bacterium]|nr:Eco57I restriction-modification methylase domain-containing protein [Phycisphaeraceae bacterium]